MKTRVVIALAVLTLASVARAEIYEWRDASGTRHFTNNKESVPSEHRAALRVVMAEPAQTAAAEAPQPAVKQPPLEAQVVYDEQAVRRAYEAGLRDGLDYGSVNVPAAAPSVQINGP